MMWKKQNAPWKFSTSLYCFPPKFCSPFCPCILYECSGTKPSLIRSAATWRTYSPISPFQVPSSSLSLAVTSLSTLFLYKCNRLDPCFHFSGPTASFNLLLAAFPFLHICMSSHPIHSDPTKFLYTSFPPILLSLLPSLSICS